MKNNKGQVWAYGFMLGFVIIILALALAPTGKQFIDDARNTTQYENKTYEAWNETSMESYEVVGQVEKIGLDCNNDSISNFDKATCVITDFSLVYFFGALILIGGAVIIAKIAFD
jgi:hypothetical protein